MCRNLRYVLLVTSLLLFRDGVVSSPTVHDTRRTFFQCVGGWTVSPMSLLVTYHWEGSTSNIRSSPCLLFVYLYVIVHHDS